MKKTITTIILGIFLLSFASAMIAGNCEQVDVSDFNSLDNIVYSVVGNSSNLEGLNVSLNGTSIDICAELNYKPDSFTLIFLDNTTHEKEVIVYRGGGSRTKYVYENITEYIEVEKIVYVNQTIYEEVIVDSPKEEKVGFFKKIWNWIKGLFVNMEKKEK